MEDKKHFKTLDKLQKLNRDLMTHEDLDILNISSDGSAMSAYLSGGKINLMSSICRLMERDEKVRDLLTTSVDCFRQGFNELSKTKNTNPDPNVN